MSMKRALLSVSDKTGLVAFASGLHRLGVEIISTGGTMKTLREAGIPVTYVSDITGFPEIMDGRVKTLNPLIHGGILAIRDNIAHQEAMTKHGIGAIDLVAVNLYPFGQTIARPEATLTDAVENIDIGGPAMIRAAAKNFHYVTVVVNPARYSDVLDELEQQGQVTPQLRMTLAKEAFGHTAGYDATISHYLAGQVGEGLFPEQLHLVYEKSGNLRYGENPHQQAAFYKEVGSSNQGIAHARQLHGKELSFNNLVDLEAAWNIVKEFVKPAAVIIKHTNPCGTGLGDTVAQAYQKAFDADPVSAFGGIIALNRPVDAVAANKMSSLFVEAIIAPAFEAEALDILTQKKNIRILEMAIVQNGEQLDSKKISGGLLVQQSDSISEDTVAWQTVTKHQVSAEEMEQLAFAWKVVKHVKSNAIVIANDNQTLGVGAGQMNRVGAAEIALKQAGDKARGAVLASDAFFPFADTVEAAAQAGITAIIQPGGSMRDEESIAAADKHGIAMIFTAIRHFKH